MVARAQLHGDEVVGTGSRDADGAPLSGTVASYFGSFAPAPEWDDLVWWPPDVFTLANLVLDHTEAYRFVVAPPAGHHWPPLHEWSAEVHAAARRWPYACPGRAGELPSLVRRAWETVTRYRDVPLMDVRSGEAAALNAALLTLHATADAACAGVMSSTSRASPGSFEDRAWQLLQARGSLSRLSTTRVRVVPKAHFSANGITIRSLSRYLALCYESVDVRWRTVGPGPSADRGDYNILLVPWPLAVQARHFRPASTSMIENMDLDRFGFFEFAPDAPFDTDLVGSLLRAALDQEERVDAVVFPEAALRPEAIPELEAVLTEHCVRFLIAGVRCPPAATALGRNFLHFGIRTTAGWQRYEQDKHHRWCLDEAQVRQYHLTRALDPAKRWWEAIELGTRTLHVIDLGGGVTAAPLVCEDLARLDEVADLVRRTGPSLVVALLLDGPQLASRWPCRYGSVIADDPGSSVLTLTSLGMAGRCRPPGKRRSRVVAHWNSRADGLHEIQLAPGAAAVLLSTSVKMSTLWTADGRCYGDVPRLELSDVRQVRARAA